MYSPDELEHLQPIPTPLEYGFTNPDQIQGYYEGVVAGQSAAALVTSYAVENQHIQADNLHQQRELELEHLATHDTMVPELRNKPSFNSRLDDRLARNVPTAVIFCDIDDFKEVNDVWGHDVGDEVIVAFGKRLAAELRTHDEDDDADVVAHERFFTPKQVEDKLDGSEGSRFGGDEFVVMLNPNGHKLTSLPEEQLVAVDRVMERIEDIHHEAIEEVAQKHGIDFSGSGISMGSAIAQPGEHREVVLKRADDSLYKAKEAKPNRKGRGKK